MLKEHIVDHRKFIRAKFRKVSFKQIVENVTTNQSVFILDQRGVGLCLLGSEVESLCSWLFNLLHLWRCSPPQLDKRHEYWLELPDFH